MTFDTLMYKGQTTEGEIKDNKENNITYILWYWKNLSKD